MEDLGSEMELGEAMWATQTTTLEELQVRGSRGVCDMGKQEWRWLRERSGIRAGVVVCYK
jgi:hypothetical protein